MALIGRRFPFDRGYIEFLGEGIVQTLWGKGRFLEVGNRIFDVCWNGHTHKLTFNADYTWYYSIRTKPRDYAYTHGSWGTPLPPPSSPWVSCQLAGGMGNRLFQVAAALGVAERLNRRVVFYTPVNTAMTHQSAKHIYSLFPQLEQIEEGEDSIELNEPDGHEYIYGLDLPETDKNIILFGYRQHMNYFPTYPIRPSFGNFESILSKYKLTTEEDRRKTWFIHIRLGDFLLIDVLKHVTVESYHRHLFCKIPEDANIILFSNGLDSAKGILQKHLSRPFVVCEEHDERIALYIMSQCWGGAIGANSTFSWWGTYLAYHSTSYPLEYKAYFPEEWVSGKMDAGICAPWAFKSPVYSKVGKQMELVGITICVNFDDILFHTIDQNAKVLKELYVVTDAKDSATIDLLATKNLPNVKVLFYDHFFTNAKFNKGGAVRFAQKYIHALYDDVNVLLLDADVVVHDTLIANLPEKLEPDVLYGVTGRLDYHTLEDFLARKNGNSCWYGGAFVGFFQLYKGNDKYLYKDSESCATCDNDFRDSFSRRIYIKETIAHLGVSQVNWEGRDYTKDNYKK